MSSQESHHHLLSGFVGHRAPQIPQDLISLMILFYDETTYWKLSNEELREFKSRRNGQVMYGPAFKLDDIEFVTTLCPFGWKPQQSGSVQFYIELRSLPQSISSVTVYYELWCAQTHSHCKKLRTFRHPSDAQSWGTNNMRFAECAKYDKLEFASLVKVLRVVPFKKQEQLQKPSQMSRAHFEIMMPATTRYTWRLSDAQIKKMSAGQEGKFWYSPSFGRKCFCLELAPNGWHHSNRGTLMLYLRLLALPHRVELIECEVSFGSTPELLPSWTLTHTFCYDVHGLQWGLGEDWAAAGVASAEKLSKLSEVEIEMCIEVVRVRSIDGTEVPRKLWAQYGVV